ncbi:hypothetical protein [Colwellia sp. MEBiC06753]
MNVYNIKSNSNKINRLESIELNDYQLRQWLDKQTVENTDDIQRAIINLSHRYQESNKWVLVISSDKHTQQLIHDNPLSKGAKMLWVHANKVNVEQANIEKTLLKGNCAALVLCNAQLDAQQINHIEQCAALGKTHCVLLNQTKKLH